MNWEVPASDIELHSTEYGVGIQKTIYTYKVPKSVMCANQDSTTPKAQPASTTLASDFVSSTEQLDMAQDDEKPPFYNHVVGLILSDMHHDDLPFPPMGTRAQ